MNKKLFVISGSSGVGKGTVIGGFLKRNPDFMLSISCTTRKPRTGEKEGVNYFYLSQEDFKNSIEEHKFLEYAQFAGNYYGTKKKFILQSLEAGKNIILEIDTQGALQVKSKMPEAVLIFISPPSYETLENRLRGRSTEDEEAIKKRLESVKLELARAENFDYKIINDDLEKTICNLEELIKKELE
ncbi:MAG: guanylate kinase [Candidatus Gastranaerophilales bacterium]